MTELYKVLFTYDTDKEDELAVKEGETIRITNKESPDWWLAERLSNPKEYGLVPNNFIEKLVTKEGMQLAIVIHDYTAQNTDELSLQKDGVITILDQHAADGYWKGDLNGKTGLFPADCVELIDEDTKAKKDTFKLAAFGVKQGGIGSILAGGLNLKRTSTNRTSVNERSSIMSNGRKSMNERPTSTNTVNSSSAPVVPSKPHPSLLNPANKNESNKKAMVIHSYVPENDDEINLMRGEYVTVIDHLEDDGWWKGLNERGATGIFPSNFVQILDEETPPPPPPTRTRPPTVKSETTEHEKPRAPPVPVGTRPTSLLTQRDNTSSSNAPSPPARPITSPPPRPITSPPIPTRRPAAPPKGHKRIPSIPLMSPDLPPVSPVLERPTRPIPHPSSNDTVVPEKTVSKTNQDALLHMAKPPKVNFKTNDPVAPPRSRPVSENTKSMNSEPLPPVPKRSMPPTPTSALPSIPVPEDPLAVEVRHLIHAEIEKIRKEFEYKLETERIERLKLQVELDELKKQII